MKADVRINALWRRYTRLYPEGLRRWMQSEMAQALAHRDAGQLAAITGAGLDCGEHSAAMAGFRAAAEAYWVLTDTDLAAGPDGLAAVKASLRGGLK